MNSHAQIPTVLVLSDRFRVYFASRPKDGLSLTGVMDLDRKDPLRIIQLYEHSIIPLGPAGHFDEHGVMPQSVLWNEGQVWLYYGGWSRRETIPYSNWSGLAISEDQGLTFRKAYPGPVIDRTPSEIFSATGCFVLREYDSWHLWYASGEKWIPVRGKLEEYYVVKYATSNDGINWNRENRSLLSSTLEFEPKHRPSVFLHEGVWHMYFCYRGLEDFRDGENSYRIGYATSNDLVNWSRSDVDAGISVSESGWDSKMMAYPYIVQADGQWFMFYCGNGFGQEGFGVAVAE